MFSSFFNFPAAMRFEQQYRCRSMALVSKDNLENGGKIVLPTSALDQLARLNIEYPMLFELTSRQGKVTHCGVQEFVAEEGFCYLPYWMMQLLLINEGDIIGVRNVSLPKGSYVKLQPVDESFLEVSNPKVVLEIALRNWAALTQGDIICITYNKRKYEISVLEIKPVNATNAISIIETDIFVDFAPSQEQERRARERAQAAPVAESKPAPQPAQEQKLPSTAAAQPAPEPPKEVEKFPGMGRSLRGTVVPPTSTSTSSGASGSTSSATPAKPLNRSGPSSSTSSSSTPSPSQPTNPLNKSGGLVFGAPAKPKPQPTASTSSSTSASTSGSTSSSTSTSTSTSTSSSSEKGSFVPFSGQGRSLRG